jgi:hypothetical protein
MADGKVTPGKVNANIGQTRLEDAWKTLHAIADEYKSDSSEYAALVESKRLVELEMRYEGVTEYHIRKLHGG